MAESRRKTLRNRYKTELCNNRMTFSECEMAILRHSVDEREAARGEKVANSPEIVEIIRIVEEFIADKKLVCYGGTAINNILPKFAQFYDKNIEIPDYDFFSPTAMDHAKELADIYARHGYEEVEAKAGMHEGTYKVYVNFLPVADITYLHPVLFDSLKRESISLAGIRYAPANYLRMGMFLELSRPDGDVSRWEKVLKRINLLNKHYPLTSDAKRCGGIDFQRKMSGTLSEKIYVITRDSLIDQGVVFFGGYAASLYARYAQNRENRNRLTKKTPDFDVLADNPERCARILKDQLMENGVRGVRLIQHTALGEVVPEHIEVVTGKETIAFLYRPVACHGYNTIQIGNKEVNVATIDTMLSFYLAFLYANKPYYDETRILCMSAFLFQMELQNRLEQRGLLKRFATKCYGKQETLEDIRAKKTRRFKELAKTRKSKEYEAAFLKYNPAENTAVQKQPKMAEPTRKPVEKTLVLDDGEPESEAATTPKKGYTPVPESKKKFSRKRTKKPQRVRSSYYSRKRNQFLV
jgi:hypothetical protein